MIPDAAALEIADHLEQLGDLGVVKRRRRLVHDEHARIVGERLGDFHHLLFGDRQIADDGARIEGQVEMGEQLRRLAVELVLVEQQAEGPLRLAADEDVLRDGEVIHQLQFLMNDADPGVLRFARTGESDLAGRCKGSCRCPWCRRQRGSSSASTCRRRSRPSAHALRPASARSGRRSAPARPESSC